MVSVIFLYLRDMFEAGPNPQNPPPPPPPTYGPDTVDVLWFNFVLGLRCLDIFFQSACRYFSIALKVILSLSDLHKMFAND